MDLLPVEIKKYIFLYSGDESINPIKLTCRDWYYIYPKRIPNIDYINILISKKYTNLIGWSARIGLVPKDIFDRRALVGYIISIDNVAALHILCDKCLEIPSTSSLISIAIRSNSEACLEYLLTQNYEMDHDCLKKILQMNNEKLKKLAVTHWLNNCDGYKHYMRDIFKAKNTCVDENLISLIERHISNITFRP